jgi:hypothetical protein
MRAQLRLVALIVLFITLPACHRPPRRKPVVTSLPVSVATLAKSEPIVWAIPPACPDGDLPLVGPAAGPLNPMPGPSDWWTSLPPTALARRPGHATVGFELLFDHVTQFSPTCTRYRQSTYRALIRYDLSSSQSLKGSVKKAILTFGSVNAPANANPTAVCQAVTGGASSLLVVRQGSTLPSQPFVTLGSLGSVPYPTGDVVFPFPVPWSNGPITSGVQPGVTVTTSASGTGTATFTVDVGDILDAALNRGDSTLAFMLGGTMEGTPAYPSASVDCKTTYRFNDLAVTH